MTAKPERDKFRVVYGRLGLEHNILAHFENKEQAEIYRHGLMPNPKYGPLHSWHLESLHDVWFRGHGMGKEWLEVEERTGPKWMP